MKGPFNKWDRGDMKDCDFACLLRDILFDTPPASAPEPWHYAGNDHTACIKQLQRHMKVEEDALEGTGLMPYTGLVGQSKPRF